MVACRSSTPRRFVVRSWDVLGRDLVLGAARWRVHSVFERALNLVDERGVLLGVVTRPAGNGPATVVLEADDAAPAFGTVLVPGEPARLDRSQPSGPRLVIGERLTLDLDFVTLWKPAPIRRSLDEAEVGARMPRAVKLASDLAPNAGLAALLPEAEALASTPAAEPAVDCTDPIVSLARLQVGRLAAAIRAQDWGHAFMAAQALSGLGPGLTPAGDDLLAGLALGLRAGLGALPGPLSAALSEAVEGRTTDLAVARVRHAIAGRADEAVHRLLTALVDGPDDLDAAVGAALDYGHSSGTDTLVGLIVGLVLGTT